MALSISGATKGLSQMVKSPEVIAIASSVFITPIVQPFVNRFIQSVPLLRNHTTTALIIVGLIIFLIASRIKQGILRAVIIGVAGSLFILGIAPVVNQFVRR